MNGKCNLFKEEDCQPLRSVSFINTILVFHTSPLFGSEDGIRYNVSRWNQPTACGMRMIKMK
jgi:hypothetical protein